MMTPTRHRIAVSATLLLCLPLSALGDPPDFNGDGSVGPFDLAILLGNWGPCPDQGACPADLNGDGEVNAFDLAMLLGAWG